MNQGMRKEVELLEERPIAIELLEYRVDQDGLARRLVGEQVGMGRRLRVCELPKNHDTSCLQERHDSLARIRTMTSWANRCL